MTTAVSGVLWHAPQQGGALVRGTAGTEAEAAVREVYDAQFGRLAGWATKLVGDPDLAHDFATEAFVRLIGRWDSVDEPRAWLYATVANLVRDHWRRRGREATAYERHQAGTDDQAGLGRGDIADTLTVRDAVQALPERLRMPVLLHYFADLSVAQVASHLGKSEGTIKRDLYDARARMAGLLEGAR